MDDGLDATEEVVDDFTVVEDEVFAGTVTVLVRVDVDLEVLRVVDELDRTLEKVDDVDFALALVRGAVIDGVAFVGPALVADAEEDTLAAVVEIFLAVVELTVLVFNSAGVARTRPHTEDTADGWRSWNGLIVLFFL